MKKLGLIFGMIVFTFSMNAQSSEMEFVNQAEGQTKSEIFSKVSKWIALTYNSANDVVQLSDVEGGNIVVKAKTSTTVYSKGVPATSDYDYSLSVSVREGKYKVLITISKFPHDLNGGDVDEDIINKTSDIYDRCPKKVKKVIGEKDEFVKTAISMAKDMQSQLRGFCESINLGLYNSIVKSDSDDW